MTPKQIKEAEGGAAIERMAAECADERAEKAAALIIHGLDNVVVDEKVYD